MLATPPSGGVPEEPSTAAGWFPAAHPASPAPEPSAGVGPPVEAR